MNEGDMGPVFRATVSRVSRMFWPFKKKHLSERSRAIKDGRLVDMQLPPFRQFNQISNNDFRVVMTKAAYRACVQLPDEVMGKAEVPANARWGMVFLSFMEEFQHRDDNPQEGTFDVNVLMPGGFQIPKALKIVADSNFDGEDAFVFMLPAESWPSCISTKKDSSLQSGTVSDPSGSGTSTGRVDRSRGPGVVCFSDDVGVRSPRMGQYGFRWSASPFLTGGGRGDERENRP